MSVFTWFSRKSDYPQFSGAVANASLRERSPLLFRDKQTTLPPPPPRANIPAGGSELRKAKRHARREQLYLVVREAMARATVPTVAYKFKVLSLDQRGDQFLVMLDLKSALGQKPDSLTEIESFIVQTAKTRFEILVTALYWRVEVKKTSAVGLPAEVPTLTNVPEDVVTQNTAPSFDMNSKKPASQCDPIQNDELEAFKQALKAGSASANAGATNGKIRTGLHSYTLLTGYEDTEMSPLAALPALSATQYGDVDQKIDHLTTTQ